MPARVQLLDDAKRALREAENFCLRANVAILAPEHLLAGALLILGRGGRPCPGQEALEAALASTVGTGSLTLTDNVMFGSGAKAAVEAALTAAAGRGQEIVGALDIAMGVIASGEVNPMFYAALDTDADALLLRLV
jgi:hypothetical protein